MPGLLELAEQGLDPYAFDPRFEAEVVVHLCRSARFYNLFGEHFSSELFTAPQAQLAVEFAKKVYAETSRPPGGVSVVVQRLAEERKRGKKSTEIDAVIDYLEATLDSPLGIADETSVGERVRSVLQKDMRRQFVEKAIGELKPNASDFGKLAKDLETIEGLGREESRRTRAFGGGYRSAWEDIAELADVERMPLGIEALDKFLDGGICRAGLSVICGEPGFGKSQACCHAAAAAVKTGAFVIFLSVELSTGEVFARCASNISGVPVKDIKKAASKKFYNPAVIAQVDAALAPFIQKGGILAVGAMTAGTSTIEDCIAFIKQEQAKYGRKPDLIIIDPADRLGVTKAKSDYAAAAVIYNGFRAYLESEKIFGLTSSQATRKKSGKDARRYIDLQDMADSIHKARIADIVISINEDPDDGSMFFFVAKHRTGDSRKVIGNFRTDFALARMIKESSLNHDVLPTEDGL